MKIPQPSIARLAFASVTLLAAGSAHAATITGVTIEGFSSERGGFSRPAANAINGSGFDAVAGTHDSAKDTSWETNDKLVDDLPSITFDLGAIYDVDSFSVWNFNMSGQTAIGLQNVTVNYGDTTSLGSTLGSFTFAEASGADGDTGETFNLTPITARYIQFDASSNHGGARGGLSEVTFDAVPEPSSWALISASLLGISLLRRRRG